MSNNLGNYGDAVRAYEAVRATLAGCLEPPVRAKLRESLAEIRAAVVKLAPVANLDLCWNHPKPGENGSLRFCLKGYVGHLYMNIPFESIEQARDYAEVRAWKIVREFPPVG